MAYSWNSYSLSIVAIMLLLTVKFTRAYYEKSKLEHIPTVGPNGLLTSYLTAFKWITRATEIVDEGYGAYPGGIFKIPTIQGWMVFVHGNKMVDDIRKASDEQLSTFEVADEMLKSYYTIHPNLNSNPYHVDIVRTPLTRNIGTCFSEMYDEVKAVFEEKVPMSDDWIEIATLDTSLDVVVRAANRFFVGLPLCRDPDFCKLNIEFTRNVFTNALLIGLFPHFLEPIVGRIFSARRSAMRRILKHLKPIIERRVKMQERFGKDWPDKPNDFIQWSLDAEKYAPLSQRTSVEDLCARLLTVNIGAVHTTSTVLTAAVFRLASRPDLAEPLRKEAKTVIEKEGWTKTAMVKMRLLDSFLKESIRLNGNGAFGMMRRPLKDFTFSDGRTVPAGTFITVPARSMALDDAIFPSGHEFQPFRFSDLREHESARESIKHQLVTPTLEWTIFGQGKHACPGRFFASTQVKAVLVHILLNYDVKFPDDSGLRPGEIPPPFEFLGMVVPNQSAKVMLRKRKMSEL